MAKQAMIRWVLVLGIGATLAGCEEGQQPLGFLKKADADSSTAVAAAPRAQGRTVERDVEAPEVFSADGEGLWDGRPSLGGVWIAHPDVKDPERVIIRNAANGKSVIGALFRRERDNPGPKLQVSSDAAATLGMLAGAPARLSVVALRREETPIEPEAAPEASPSEAAGTIGAEKIEAKPLDEITSNAANAIAAASAKPATPPAAAAPAAKPPAAAAPAATAKPAASSGSYVQIGIFSVEANAKRAADQLAKAGIAQSIRKEESQGKTFWRVLAGPAASAAERDAMTTKIKGLGYNDAYAVSN